MLLYVWKVIPTKKKRPSVDKEQQIYQRIKSLDT